MEATLNDNKRYDFMEDENEPEVMIKLAVENNIVVEDGRKILVKEIAPYETAVSYLSDLASKIIVDDEEGSKWALDICADARTTYRAIEDARKKAIEPDRKKIQFINDYSKELQQKLDEIISKLTIELAKWQQVQRERAEIAQESVKNLSESLGLDMEIVAPSAPKTLSSFKASTSSRERVTFEIENADLVPDEYWIIDERAIQKHISLGKREIPGIKIIKEKTMIIRRK